MASALKRNLMFHETFSVVITDVYESAVGISP